MKLRKIYNAYKNYNKVKLFYAAGGRNQNFGDILSSIVVENISKKNVIRASKTNADIVAIGSVLEMFYLENIERCNKKPLKVWGAGFIESENVTNLNIMSSLGRFGRSMDFHAVRGKLTLKRIEHLGYDISKIKMGDPGLLVSEIFNIKVEKQYEIGIVPHYVDKESHLIEKLKNAFESCLIIDVYNSPEAVINDICKCNVIMSSAMHGLIVSDSFNIPNVWVKFSDKIIGDGYKFNDYYSIFGIKPTSYSVADLLTDQCDIISFICANYEIKPQDVFRVINDLKSCFPL